MKKFLFLRLLPLLASTLCLRAEARPNVVLFFMDDMGYADPGCYGGQGYATPNMDRLAREGAKFTDFYVSSAVCSASRSALLTGCYHERVSIRGALMPDSKIALALAETTIAEMLASHGYATGMVGKWHLGAALNVLPMAQGFQSYYGLPYSNDMWPHNPNSRKFSDLPLYENDKVVNASVDPDASMQLPTEYAKRAVQFIETNKEKPFFLYFAHNMPHVPLAVHPSRKGKSGSGYYGDVMQEIDWTVGEVLDCLDRNKLAEKTLVIFTSDNGPWETYGNHSGKDGGLREGKGTSFEGGVRVPCMARFPGKIPAGTVHKHIAGTIDVLPTLAEVTGAKLPEKKLDGVSLWPLLQGKEAAKPPHEALFFYYANNQLQSMRSGPWKLYFPHESLSNEGAPIGKDGRSGKPGRINVLNELYQLETDPNETQNVFEKEPEVVARLTALAATIRGQLGDTLTQQKGTEVRVAEQLEAAAESK